MFMVLVTGIGGSSGLVLSSPIHLSCLRHFKNCSSVQLPSPVLSGVRLAAKVTPQGPIQAVSVVLTASPLFQQVCGQYQQWAFVPGGRKVIAKNHFQAHAVPSFWAYGSHYSRQYSQYVRPILPGFQNHQSFGLRLLLNRK